MIIRAVFLEYDWKDHIPTLNDHVYCLNKYLKYSYPTYPRLMVEKYIWNSKYNNYFSKHTLKLMSQMLYERNCIGRLACHILFNFEVCFNK